jgi:N-acetylglucosamine malate deacetylase 1
MLEPEPQLALVRVLAIHAHPDDLELQCAGTLLQLKQRGCQVTMVTMTPGDCGSAEHTSDEIAEIRRAEARRSAELLGADYVCLEFRDLSIEHSNESRRKVTELVRRVRPQLVITAPPVDYMSDHEVTSRLVRDACFNASVPLYLTQSWDPAPALSAIPHLYYVDPIEGLNWYGQVLAPDFVVDVSSQMDRKLAMLACHASQRDWLRRQHGMDEYLDGCRRWGAHRGAEIGVGYGEGFTQHRGHPYPCSNLLSRLLGDDPVATSS